jgi:actin related protein 2/3 complex subunit 2
MLTKKKKKKKQTKGLTSNERQGFVSFVLHPAHQAKRANTISNIQIFRNYLHFHIKCTKVVFLFVFFCIFLKTFSFSSKKAYMHTRMRTRVRALLLVLNRAKVEPYVKAEKKTISGKTFKRR